MAQLGATSFFYIKIIALDDRRHVLSSLIHCTFAAEIICVAKAKGDSEHHTAKSHTHTIKRMIVSIGGDDSHNVMFVPISKDCNLMAEIPSQPRKSHSLHRW